MKNEKKLVKEITTMEEDFAKWYTDVVKKAELMDYSSVRGCMILEPYGYAIWENIRNILDANFKKTGHKNVAMPMFIPESLLEKEKDHVQGFAPEVAWVTHGGSEKLTEKLCVRPTSEVLFCEHFANKVESWRDLPKLYNQWCSVVRWEKTTRPFLRSIEFHWQEGHTIHETAEEAQKETEKMLNIYTEFCENQLAIPVFKGEKTDREKFAGAEKTYTVESMMHDGKALQSATSHYFGNSFAKAFDIKFQNRENKSEFVYQTSWGMSTRIIGGIIMVHGDNSGLVLPPAIAPIQVIIIPIAKQKGGVLQKAGEISKKLNKKFRVELDISDKTPGWKFAEYEMKGVPLRLEIGPKDIEKNQCVVVRRDNREKIFVNLDELEIKIPEILENYRISLFKKAQKRNESMLKSAVSWDEFESLSKIPGFIKAMWCGDVACEEKIKSDFGITSRCILSEKEKISETCVCCEKKAIKTILWGKSY